MVATWKISKISTIWYLEYKYAVAIFLENIEKDRTLGIKPVFFSKNSNHLKSPVRTWPDAEISYRESSNSPPEIRARAHWPLCLATSGRVFVAGIFIPVGNHYFQALASTLQFVAQVCDRLWLVPATDRAFAYITCMWPPHVALVCLDPPQKRGHLWLNKVARKVSDDCCSWRATKFILHTF